MDTQNLNTQNLEVQIPNHYSFERAERHRHFGVLISESMFGGAGCTLPSLITAENFNKRCKRNYENREKKKQKGELECSLASLVKDVNPELFIG